MPLNCSYLKHTSLLQSYVFSPLPHLAEEGLWGASLPPGLSPLMALMEQQVGEQSGAKSALFPACLPSLHMHFACDQQGWKQLGDLGLSLVQPSAPSLLLQQPETFTKAIRSSVLLPAHWAAPAWPWHLSPNHSKGLLFPWATQHKQDDLQPQESLLAAV